MMSSAEVLRWREVRSRGYRAFLIRSVVHGLPHVGILLLFLWWLVERIGLSPVGFYRPVLVAIVAIIGANLLFAVAWWRMEEKRHARRGEAEERGEVPRTIGA